MTSSWNQESRESMYQKGVSEVPKLFEREQPVGSVIPMSVKSVTISATEVDYEAWDLGYIIQILLSDGTIKEQRGDLRLIIDDLAPKEWQGAMKKIALRLRDIAERDILG